MEDKHKNFLILTQVKSNTHLIDLMDEIKRHNSLNTPNCKQY